MAEHEPGPSLLTADEILAADDMETVDVEVPEWSPKDGSPPRSVRLRRLTPEDLADYGEMIENPELRRHANLLLVQRSAINAEGRSLFGPKQIDGMKKKSAKAFNRLARAALKLNGIDQETSTAKNA